MAEILIPSNMLKFTAGMRSVVTIQDNVLDCLQDLETQHPLLKNKILDTAGRPHRFVRIYVDNADSTKLDLRSIKSDSSQKIDILLALAGG